jgi:hypothetical protein
MEIRWDTTRMGELAANLDTKGTRLMSLRGDVTETCARARRPPVDLSTLVITSLWAESNAEGLVIRQGLLNDAEAQLLWDLTPSPPPGKSRAPLRSRAAEDIEAELDAALGQLSAAPDATGLVIARAEVRVIELTYELAVAERNRLLLEHRLPDVSTSLSELIDYLGYEIAKAQPVPTLDWHRVAEATTAVRRLLDESWFGDVGRADLLAINDVVAGLEGPEFDAVILGLSDDELYRWFHEFDGVRGGNLSEAEEDALFDTFAATGSAATLLRLAGAEGSSRFLQIADAVQRTAPSEVGMEFIEACAAQAADSEEALLATLAGLARLDRRRRNIVGASLHLQGLLDPLAMATTAFLERQTIERDNPIVVEFFAGLGAAIGTAARTLGELTVAGVVDRDRFRDSWSAVGGLVGTAFTDPADFVEVVLDIETLRRNPARWTGSAAAGLLTAGVGRVARPGHLGKMTGSAAAWLERISDTVILSGRRLQLRAGHVPPALDRVGVALDAAAVSAAISELALVDEYLDELADECAPSASTD